MLFADGSLSRGSPAGLTRRTFLRSTALVGGGLLLGYAPSAEDATLVGAAGVDPARGEVPLTAWVRVTPDNLVTLVVSQAEIGQGISTTLPAILADELGADWATVRLETAPFAPAYRNPTKNWMFTGNSESIQAFSDLMRQMGAAAREMLVNAAAARWGVPSDSCRAEKSQVIHVSSGRHSTFGEVAAEASRLPVPSNPRLKSPEELTLVGKPLPRIDIPAKVDGSATFGIDMRLPGMLTAAVRTAPTLSGRLRGVDGAPALGQPGVRAVVPLDNGVAVVADTYWQARTALSRLEPDFDPGPDAGLSSRELSATYRRALEAGPWATPLNEGNLGPAPDPARRSSPLSTRTPSLLTRPWSR